MEFPKIKVADFEGPFDLLLHLIKKNKMDIYNIEIHKITNQYLNYLDTMKKMDLEITSEFIVVAATLIEIKSKNLLPKPKVEENFYEEPELPKTIEEVRRQVVYEPKVEYVVVEKKSDNDMFTLEEYRQMRAILEVIKENQKKA